MLKLTMERTLVVGAGLTGAVASAFLRECLPAAAKLTVWDKAGGTGGRMSTSRSNQDGRCTVDLGAQYISATPEYQSKHGSHYKELLSASVLKPLTATIEGHTDKEEGTLHYITPDGVSSLVKYFLNKSGAEKKVNHLLKCVDVKDSVINVKTDKGVEEEFDAVILTMPVPQILQLQGNINSIIESKPEVKKNLESVSYSSRFALGLFFSPETQLNYPWAAKYITDNPCVRFVSIDNKKRACESKDIGPSMCVHTSVPFSLKHLETDKEDMKAVILEHLRQVLPDLPEPIEVKSHKWRYSQVFKGYAGGPGCVVLSEDPPLILAGDAFVVNSRFDGCIESAQVTSDKLKSYTQPRLNYDTGLIPSKNFVPVSEILYQCCERFIYIVSGTLQRFILNANGIISGVVTRPYDF